MRRNPAGWIGRLIIVVLILVAFTGRAPGQATSNRWQAVTGNYNGDFSDSGHWDLGSAPATTNDNIIFDNYQAAAYTVRLTGNANVGRIHVTTDKVTYDLNGYKWYAPALESSDYFVGDPNSSHCMARMAGEVATVTFSSSHGSRGADGNSLDFGQNLYAGAGIGDGTRASTLIIDDSLGYPVKLILPWDSQIYGANLVISGAGSELSQPNGVFHTWAGNILVKNGGLLNIWAGYSPTYFAAHSPLQSSTTTVDGATLMTYGRQACVGLSTKGTLILSNNAVWMAGPEGISATEWRFVWDPGNPYLGEIYVNRSSIYDEGSFTIGETNNSQACGYGLGNVELENASLLIVSNGVLTIHPQTFTTGGNTYSNRLILRDSIIVLGSSTNSGAIVNEGIFQAAGAIVGQGPANAALENHNLLSVGDTLGALSLTNGDLHNNASGTVSFEFSTNLCDHIDIISGTATIGGTCVFSTVSFAPAPRSNRTWDFVRADSITYTAADNLTNLMASHNMQLGGDYAFGVVDIPGGRKALRLRIYPQPSMMLELR